MINFPGNALFLPDLLSGILKIFTDEFLTLVRSSLMVVLLTKIRQQVMNEITLK